MLSPIPAGASPPVPFITLHEGARLSRQSLTSRRPCGGLEAFADDAVAEVSDRSPALAPFDHAIFHCVLTPAR
ncbi:hypothetical protein [Streptomyces sp. NPDC002640]